MKNIIGHGYLKTKKAVCPYCDCEFTFNITDIDNNFAGPSLSCPLCNGTIERYIGTGFLRQFFESFEDYKEKEDSENK